MILQKSWFDCNPNFQDTLLMYVGVLQSGTVFLFIRCCGGKVTWSALTPTHVWILTTKMGDHHDLPFKAEYAKSGRSSCKACKSNIGQGSLRLAVMVQVGTSLHFVAEWDVDRCWYRYTWNYICKFYMHLLHQAAVF